LATRRDGYAVAVRKQRERNVKEQFTRDEVLALLAQAYWFAAYPPTSYEEAQEWAREQLLREDVPSDK